ncbi:prepilin peptidase [Candidatus Shapirobacteria bacterium]|nr:prepilin peptidase [Candidatus Shapirobacteria bacterium]
MLLFYLLIFIFGTFIGSFLNVLIDRPARGETVVWGGSYCEKCRHKLAWHDLIPLFSYLRLGGRCRYCRSPIPFWLPVVELTTGLTFVLITYFFLPLGAIDELSLANVANLSFSYVLASLLLVIFFADLKYQLVYDQVVYAAVGLTLLYRLFPSPNYQLPTPNYSLLSALAATLFFYLLYFLGPKIFHQDTMGLGDVELVFLMGIFLGYPKIIIALYLAFLTGALSGVILILGKKAKMKSQIPFGPFLVASTFISWFFGEQIWETVTRVLNLVKV